MVLKRARPTSSQPVGSSRSRRALLVASIVVIVAGLAAAGFVWSGAYNVAADEPHSAPVHAILETLRERSIAVRTSSLEPPVDLSDPARIRQGAGNYNAMCMGCHLAPGMAETEMSRGLYPAPPDLSKASVDASEAFWVIKHGIKASGMPAWGESMGDEYIWNMAAFLQVLPGLDTQQYQALVASSGGHDHGGGETPAHHGAAAAAPGHHDMPMTGTPKGGSEPHVDPPGAPAHDHPPANPHAGADRNAASGDTSPGALEQRVEHRHADGTVESHPAPPPEPPAPADDGHNHQH